MATELVDNPPNYYKARQWVRSTVRNPYPVNPYSAITHLRRSAWGECSTISATSSWPATYVYNNIKSSTVMGPLNSRVYAEFVEMCGSASEWAVNLIEADKTFKMIGEHLMKMYRSLRYMKQKRFRKAFEALGHQDGSVIGRRFNKTVGSEWLAWHFGAAPLMQDIYNGIDLLSNSESWKNRIRVSRQSKETKQTSWYPTGWQQDYRITKRVTMVADVEVTNPNLYLAGRMGLINPASIAWELIPFSFVFDWVVPVGNFLKSWSDFAGLTLTNATTSYKLKAVGKTIRKWDAAVYGEGLYESEYFTRELGINYNPNWIKIGCPSKMRALTAISLIAVLRK